jgi:maltose/moltooligosaccharide transporter
VIRLGCQNLAVDETLFFIGLFYVASLYFFSLSVVRYGWQQVCLGLRCGNNTAMEPYRAFIADTPAQPAQQPTGFQAQSFFTGLANFANVSFIFSVSFVGTTGNYQLGFFAFFLGAVCSIGSVWWSSILPKKIPPTEEELKKIKKIRVFTPFTDIFSAIKDTKSNGS